MGLDEFAKQRYDDGIKEGRDPQPWADENRNHILDATEEMADGFNYVNWDIIRTDLGIGPRQSTKFRHHLVVARESIANAYAALERARDEEQGRD